MATWQLVQLNKEIIEDHPVCALAFSHSKNDYKEIQTNNTYAELVYKALGSVGYWIYYVCSLITLYGSNIGSMVVMTDFLEAIPIGSNRKLRRIISQVILTVLCILLCLLKDPKWLFLYPLTAQNAGRRVFSRPLRHRSRLPRHDHACLLSLSHSPASASSNTRSNSR